MGFYKPGANHTANPKMARLHKIIWALIFGGLLFVILGLFVSQSDDAVGWMMMGGGVVLTVAGAVLVFVRSTMPDA